MYTIIFISIILILEAAGEGIVYSAYVKKKNNHGFLEDEIKGTVGFSQSGIIQRYWIVL